MKSGACGIPHQCGPRPIMEGYDWYVFDDHDGSAGTSPPGTERR